MIDTNAVGPSDLAAGKLSNFSISGKEISIRGLRVLFTSLSIDGKRCSVCGPKIKSTYGARRRIASPS